VTFGFTAAGRRAFQELAAGVARRGGRVSSPGQTLNQHFAIALDNQLIEVPSVDYKQYPDGITTTTVMQLSGHFTSQFARDVAILLRYGPLPVDFDLTAVG
jgi:preprotein translocase subunit SecD